MWRRTKAGKLLAGVTRAWQARPLSARTHACELAGVIRARQARPLGTVANRKTYPTGCITLQCVRMYSMALFCSAAPLTPELWKHLHALLVFLSESVHAIDYINEVEVGARSISFKTGCFLNIVHTTLLCRVCACAQRTSAAARESLRRDPSPSRPAVALMSPAFHACGSACPLSARCSYSNQ
jgi:hypothetical protein